MSFPFRPVPAIYYLVNYLVSGPYDWAVCYVQSSRKPRLPWTIDSRPLPRHRILRPRPSAVQAPKPHISSDSHLHPTLVREMQYHLAEINPGREPWPRGPLATLRCAALLPRCPQIPSGHYVQRHRLTGFNRIKR